MGCIDCHSVCSQSLEKCAAHVAVAWGAVRTRDIWHVYTNSHSQTNRTRVFPTEILPNLCSLLVSGLHARIYIKVLKSKPPRVRQVPGIKQKMILLRYLTFLLEYQALSCWCCTRPSLSLSHCNDFYAAWLPNRRVIKNKFSFYPAAKFISGEPAWNGLAYVMRAGSPYSGVVCGTILRTVQIQKM